MEGDLGTLAILSREMEYGTDLVARDRTCNTDEALPFTARVKPVTVELLASLSCDN